MTYDSLAVEGSSDGFTDSHQIHLRQRGLREEAPSIYVLFGCKLIERANEFNVTVGLDKERNGRTGEGI